MNWVRGVVLLFAAASGLWAQASLKATPTSLTFTWQVGATLPASQAINVTVASGSTSLTVVSSVSTSAKWLALTPPTGKTPLTIKMTANPTGLSVGTYTATVTLNASETPSATAVTIPVTLTVKEAPPTLTVAPLSLNFTWRKGDTLPSQQTVSLSTSGALISYSATVNGSWLTATPLAAAIFPAFPSTMAVSVTPTDLAPGTYKGVITITAAAASNKSATVQVNLVVQPGTPTISTTWPDKVTAGASETTVTVTGTNFFSGTVIKIDTTTLKTTVLGTTAVLAVIPASFMSSAGSVLLTAVNPDPGGGTSTEFTFPVLPPGPQVLGVANAASFLTGDIAPGEVITIFGTGLGPDVVTPFVTPTNGVIASTLGGTTVLFGVVPAPIIYTSATQVSVIVPYSVNSGTTFMTVSYNGTSSSGTSLNIDPAAPGIFTYGNGTGQAAAFNFNETTGAYSLNTETNQVTRGGMIILYATGDGPSPAPGVDGEIATAAVDRSSSAMSLLIGGLPASIVYAGTAPGLVNGLMQINARIPDDATVGKAVKVEYKVGTATSQSGVTLAIK